jgi:hypothetical protein
MVLRMSARQPAYPEILPQLLNSQYITACRPDNRHIQKYCRNFRIANTLQHVGPTTGISRNIAATSE